MAIIKSYTDIEQSRKLAEILPIESADMYWKNGVSDKYIQCFTPFIINEYRTNVDYDYDVPCWSLAALLDVLPKNLNIGRPSLESNYKGYYWIQYYDEFMQPNNYKTECFNNPVDACVAMVEKLNEMNLL